MPFKFTNTSLPGVTIIQPRLFKDPRGFFMETYKQSDFVKAGIEESFTQDNHSYSSKGVLRGLHFQTAPYAQGKLVRVIKGSVWDVAVDVNPGSPTYKKWFGLELNEDNNTMLYIPPGYAHGFLTLKADTHLVYKCTAEYSPETDGGILWSDPELDISWPVSRKGEVLVSGKDEGLPLLKDLI